MVRTAAEFFWPIFLEDISVPPANDGYFLLPFVNIIPVTMKTIMTCGRGGDDDEDGDEDEDYDDEIDGENNDDAADGDDGYSNSDNNDIIDIRCDVITNATVCDGDSYDNDYYDAYNYMNILIIMITESIVR